MKRLIILSFLALSAMLGARAQEAPAQELQKVKFSWGASLVSAVDLSGHDMSTLGIDAYLGMKVPYVQMLGVGVGINVPVSNSLRTLPVYLLARTNFRNRPSLCFLDVRGGFSINDMNDSVRKLGEYVSVGCGINLASSRKFSSHLILAYTFMGRHDYINNGEPIEMHNLHLATLRLGISF